MAMSKYEKEVIDRLARIETKLDNDHTRLNTLETDNSQHEKRISALESTGKFERSNRKAILSFILWFVGAVTGVAALILQFVKK